MYKITFLIPLLDRSEYTKIFIDENIIDECFYLFADGSHTDENYKIFQKLKAKNIEYIRYDPDTDPNQYVKKMVYASQKINSKYTMTVDNDDFINYKGVFKCINFLESNDEYISAAGRIFYLKTQQNLPNFKKKTQYQLNMFFTSSIELDNLISLEGVKKYLDNSIDTNYFYYNIYKTQIFQNIWNDMFLSNVKDIDMFEMMQTMLSFSYGKYKYLSCNHYIRLTNAVNNNASKRKDMIGHRVIFDQKSRNKMSTMINFLKHKFNVEEKTIIEMLKHYFVRKIKPRPYYLYSVVKIFYIKFFLFFVVRLINKKFYSLKTIKKMISIFLLIKK